MIIMPEDINEKENRYKFLLSKIEDETSKFKIKLTTLDQKLQDIRDTSKVATHDIIPIALNAKNQDNVYEMVKAHILELDNLKNFINLELDKIAKQKNLQKALQQKFSNNIVVEQSQSGTFKIDYSDSDVDKISDDTLISKKLIGSLKESVFGKK